MTKLTGRLDDDRRTLVLTRQFDVPAEQLWTDFTDPDRLERWFGAWTGDPASGQVMLTMSAGQIVFRRGSFGAGTGVLRPATRIEGFLDDE